MSLKKKAARGVIWTALAQFVTQGMTFAITVVLARLLSPEAFGTVAMATVVISIGAIFQDVGLGYAVIHRSEIHEDDLSTIFWVNAGAGLILAAIVFAGAPLVAGFYGQPVVAPVLRVLSFWFLVGALLPTQVTILTRNLEFRALAVRQMGGVFAGGAVGIWMAIAGFGIWSLVGQTLAITASHVLIVWLASQWRPSLRFDFARLRLFWGYGIRVTGTQLVKNLARSSDRLLVGKYLGSGPLGYYQIAANWMMFPQIIINEIVGRVAFPTLARRQDDLQKVRHGFLVTTRIIAILILPMMAGVIVIAPELISVIYGPKWATSIVLIQFLAVVGARQGVLVMTGPVFQALGRVDFQLKWEMFSLGSMIAAVAVGLPFGLAAVAGFSAAMAILTTPILLRELCRTINLPTGDWLRSLAPAAKLTVVVTVVMAAVRHGSLLSGLPPALVLLATTIIGLAAYAAAAMLLARRDLADLLDLVMGALRPSENPPTDPSDTGSSAS